MRTIILILGLLVGSAPVLAETPFYVGAGVGLSRIKGEGAIRDISDNTGGGDVFAGFKLGNFAFEGGLIAFGSASFTERTSNADPEINEDVDDMEGYYLNVQYRLPLQEWVSLDFSAGYSYVEATVKTLAVSPPGPFAAGAGGTDKPDDNGAMVGLAATFKVAETVKLRLFGQYFDVSLKGTIADPHTSPSNFNPNVAPPPEWQLQNNPYSIKEPYRYGFDLIWDF